MRRHWCPLKEKKNLYVVGLSVGAQPVLLLTFSGMLLIMAWQMDSTLPPPTANTSPCISLSPNSIRFYYVIWYHTLAGYNQEGLVRTGRHLGYGMFHLCILYVVLYKSMVTLHGPQFSMCIHLSNGFRLNLFHYGNTSHTFHYIHKVIWKILHSLTGGDEKLSF